MKFETKIFDEPHLEFGDKHHHPDPRLGLFEAGPLQIPLGDVVNIAVVGDAKTIEDAKAFFTGAAAGFKGKGDKHPNLHPDFPGLGNQNPFRCKFEIEEGATAAISQSKIDKIRKEPHHRRAVEMAVEEIVQQLQVLDEGSHRPDVAIIALPVSLIERVWNAKVDSKSTVEKDDSGGSDAPDFRGMLKAKAMNLSFPIQIVWEDVFDESAKIPRKIKENRARKIQDQAGRTWNLLTTLYYKGTGRIPWRKMPNDGEFTACYIGVSFYREVGGQQLFTSAAQMFDERGRGFILKGKRAFTESRGRHPYMTRVDARQLIADALAAYKNHHKNYPARVIVLKTSQFREEEADGILEALDEAGAELRDLVWVQESYSVKVLRDGNYPVMRGTFVDLGGKGLLYTNGSIPYYGTYPGMYDPRPLLLCPYKGSDSTIAQIASEVLALTKINWNSTQMNQKLPIPIRAARAVGEVLKHVTDEKVSSDYARYI
ncbi:argonaute/piwi family protein [Hyphomicrobium sp. MC8b]|uniref:argonaute/piwi family protein n=1 Tax=Hyphomicrobium sp. MC8b TaxID=300273 RepID=UPI00391B9428